jgi:hypothetical protein
MTKSTLILLCIAFTISMAILTLAASAQCSSCMKEGDWGESAKNFIEGKPIDDTPQLFGPKAERQKNSELASDSDKAQESANSTSTEALISAQAVGINLASISAKPSSVNSGSPVEITAVFQEKSPNQSDNLTRTGNNTSIETMGTLMITTASISSTTGIEVGKVNLARTSGNEYAGIWKAIAPADTYNVTLAVSSPQTSETFSDVLQIEVTGDDNATNGAPDIQNLG